MDFQTFLSHFQVVGSSGKETQAYCPSCGHKKLYISLSDSGQILLHCKHDCDYKDILSDAGLQPKDLYLNSTFSRRKNSVFTRRDHIYTDESGTLRAKKVITKYHTDYRTKRGKTYKAGEKSCMWILYDPEKGDFSSKFGLEGYKPLLYHVTKLKKAETVIIVEGEKDVETLEKMGYTATTSPNGAGSHWRKEYNQYLRGKRCYMLADNDEVGERYAREVACSLSDDDITVCIIKSVDVYSDINEKDDISDIVEKIGLEDTAIRLSTAIEKAKVFHPEETKSSKEIKETTQHLTKVKQ